MSRFLCVMSDRERTYEIAPGQEEHWNGVRQILANLNGEWGAGKCKGFTPDARELWVRWSRSLPDDSDPEVEGAIERARTFALKIALLLAWNDGTARQQDASDNLIEWWLTPAQLLPATLIANMHVKSVLAIQRRLAPNGDMRLRRKILDELMKGPRTLGNLITVCKSTKRTIAPLCESIAEEDLIIAQRVGNRHGYRLRTPEDDVVASGGAVGVDFAPVIPLDSYRAGGSNSSPSVTGAAVGASWGGTSDGMVDSSTSNVNTSDGSTSDEGFGPPASWPDSEG
jgi:hypothetical protein